MQEKQLHHHSFNFDKVFDQHSPSSNVYATAASGHAAAARSSQPTTAAPGLTPRFLWGGAVGCASDSWTRGGWYKHDHGIRLVCPDQSDLPDLPDLSDLLAADIELTSSHSPLLLTVTYTPMDGSVCV